MTKTILVTGAGSGFGEGVALGLAREGHNVIAAVQIWPQVTALRGRASAEGLANLRVEKLDLLDELDLRQAFTWDVDILFNNSGIGAAHGEYGFRAFSHEKAVMEERHSITHMLFPPYTGFVQRLINIVVRVLG